MKHLLFLFLFLGSMASANTIFWDDDDPAYTELSVAFLTHEYLGKYDDYKGYYEWLDTESLTSHWAKTQAYLACANMMNASASIGMDSCAIEGYKEAEVLDIVTQAAPGFDAADWQVGLLVTFGHAGEPRRQRIRESLEELVLKI